LSHFRAIDGTDVAAADYDDRAALEDYVYRHVSDFMTEFEKRCDRLGTAREKARLTSSSRARAVWEAEADEKVVEALQCGLFEFRRGIRNRILRLHQEGVLKVNRCPACLRIARTLHAKQCRWCLDILAGGDFLISQLRPLAIEKGTGVNAE
jgi:hypothetical protein